MRSKRLSDTSQEIFDLDMAAIWTRHWLSVGVEADVPGPGDFVTIDIGKYSVIIVRGEDGEARLPQCLPASRRADHECRKGFGRENRLPISPLDL